jgi:hypothetical protein
MQEANLKIGVDKMSPKNLIGECLDLSKQVLQEIIQVYCGNHNYEFPLPNQVASR